jgi:hypothetical protein
VAGGDTYCFGRGERQTFSVLVKNLSVLASPHCKIYQSLANLSNYLSVLIKNLAVPYQPAYNKSVVSLNKHLARATARAVARTSAKALANTYNKTL